MKLLPSIFLFALACKSASAQTGFESFVTDLFKEVSLGVAAGNNPLEVSKKHVFGWALAQIGIAKDDEVGLGDLSGQLSEISGTLSSMNQQLDGITNLLINSACNDMAANLNDEIVDIIRWERDYNIFLSIARGVNNRPPSASPRMLDWAEDVYAKMPSHLINFDVVLKGGNGAQSLMQTCVFNLNQIQEGEFDDDYWPTVYAYMELMYSYQTRGLFLYTEAAHYLAYDKVTENGAIDLADEDSLGHFSVCLGDGLEFCQFAIENVNLTYESILTQYSDFAGAPVSSDTRMVQYHNVPPLGGEGVPQGVMYPRSLEDFTADVDDSCSFPLTSNNPCGITTTDNSGFDYEGLTVLDYSGWTPAHASDLELLFMNIGGSSEATAGEYLESLGFRNTTDKIVFAMEETSVRVRDGPSGNLKCFFDTDIERRFIDNNTPIFCNGRTTSRLTQTSRRTSQCQSPFAATRFLRDSWNQLPSDRNGFYDGRTRDIRSCTRVENVNACSCTAFWDERDGRTPPGWWETESQKQYSLPMIKLEDQTCKFSRRNPGGAFSLCNDDLFEFLEEIIPSPPDLTEESAMMDARAAEYETSGSGARNLRGSSM